jgi:ribonuclease Z
MEEAMEKLTMLGTGCAMVTKCYNTCFTISNEDDGEHFLVDAGGGNTILTNLELLNIPITKIHNVFISHCHNDHIMGVVWIIRAVAQSIINDKYKDKLYIYCHENVVEAIRNICGYVLNKKFTKYFDDRIIFINIDEMYTAEVGGRNITFFNIQSNKDLQYGFKITLRDGKKLTFLGDEPYKEALKEVCEDVDYLLHEAYCLYSERDRFKPYEKHHATVKDACENAAKLNVGSLVLYHTEDKNIDRRKELYLKEGKEYFKGDLHIPDDLEEIVL